MADEKTVKYKIQMLIEIEGEVTGQPPLKCDTGIEPFIEWTINDIEHALNGECEIVDVKSVYLEDVTK